MSSANQIQARVSNRFDVTMSAAIVIFIVAIALVIVGGDNIGIVVKAHIPTDISPSRTHIQITLDEAIDPASATTHVKIEPAVKGNITVVDKTITFSPLELLKPGTIYHVSVEPGLSALTGQTLKRAVQWQFTVRQPRIIFLDSSVTPNLYTVDAAESAVPQQLTHDELGIISYDVSFDGKQVVYAEMQQEGSSRLLVVDVATGNSSLLYTCDKALCFNPAWSPDSNIVAFDWIDTSQPRLIRVPRVMLYDVAAKSVRPLFKDNQIVTKTARWAPDGNLLAVDDVGDAGLIIHDFPNDADIPLTLPLEKFGQFSPDSRWLFYPKVVALNDGTTAQHYVLIDVASDGFPQRDLIPDTEPSNDDEAAWMPDSSALITTRRAPFSTETKQGTKLFRVDVATGIGTPLIDDTSFRLVDLAVSPAGDAVLYHRIEPGKPPADDQYWLYSLTTGKIHHLSILGGMVRWLP